MLRKYVRYIPTADDWYPCFFENALGKCGPKNEEFRAPMVEATIQLYQISETSWEIIISLWGNDDTYIMKRQYFNNLKISQNRYIIWVSWLCNLAIAQRTQLELLGFNYD